MRLVGYKFSGEVGKWYAVIFPCSLDDVMDFNSLLTVSSGIWSAADDAEKSVSVELSSSCCCEYVGVSSRCADVIRHVTCSGRSQQRRAGLRGCRSSSLHVSQVGQESAGVRGAAVRRPGAVDRGRLDRVVRARRCAVPTAARRRGAGLSRRAAVATSVAVILHWTPISWQLIRSPSQHLFVYTPCLKKTALLFLSELRQISTTFNKFW